MSFRFKLDEPFDEGFRRIALDQIERAQTQLKSGEDQAVAVHETRKSLKRVRALLRLLRPALGDDVFRGENGALRDIGLGLSGARDQHVLTETVDKLQAAGTLNGKALINSLRAAITSADGHGEPLTTDKAVQQLDAAKKRLAAITFGASGFDLVGAGLERSYRRARRAFKHAYANPNDEAFHEWRKGTQQHWRQMLLLSRAWPDYLGARAAEARALSQILGDDHDLAMLVAFVRTREGALCGDQAAAIETAARQSQDDLRADARPRGERLFAGGARRLRKSVKAYWQAAVAMKGRGSEDNRLAKPGAQAGRNQVARKRVSRRTGV